MSTQWDIVQGVGYTRLIYEALDRPMRSAGVAPEAESDVFDGLQIMERAVLAAQSRRRKA